MPATDLRAQMPQLFVFDFKREIQLLLPITRPIVEMSFFHELVSGMITMDNFSSVVAKENNPLAATKTSHDLQFLLNQMVIVSVVCVERKLSSLRIDNADYDRHSLYFFRQLILLLVWICNEAGLAWPDTDPCFLWCSGVLP